DVGRLAAELEAYLLQVSGRCLDDQLPDLGRARERDLVDVIVRLQRGARVAEAGDDVDDAVWEPSLLQQLAEAERRQRRLLRRLEYHGASAREHWPELPRGHQQREVPRDDLTNDADRLAQ